jgi:arginine decarboxylase
VHGKNNLAWQVKQSAELYGVERWGNDYFGVSPEGNVTAKTLTKEVALLDIIHGMIERDLQMPVLLRIENILDAQIMRLNEAFAAAIANAGYTKPYRGVYPIKVNQQAQVVEEIAAFGARYHHGLEVGSKSGNDYRAVHANAARQSVNLQWLQRRRIYRTRLAGDQAWV